MGRVSKRVKQCRLNLLKLRDDRKRARLARANLTAESASSPIVNTCPNPYSNATVFSGDGTSTSSSSQSTSIIVASGLQQPNLNQCTSQTLHCLLCSKEVTQNLTSLNNGTDQETDFLVIFLLKKMLGAKSENLAEYLSTLGHPRGWVSICETCFPVVTGAFTVQKQIGELEVKLRILQDKMKETIMSSYLENKKKFQSVGAVPATIPKSNPVVVTKETRDQVVCGMKEKRINKRSIEIIMKALVTNHAKPVETKITTALAAPSKLRTFSEDSDMECDGHADFPEPEPADDKYENSSTVSNVPSNDPAELSYQSSIVPKMKKRKQTITARKEELVEKHTIRTDVDVKLEEAVTNGAGGGSQLRMVCKLMQYNQGRSSDKAAYRCAMCPNLKSMRLRSFVKHLVYHFDQPYKCSECSAYFTGDDIELAKRSSENQSGSHVCQRETLEKVNLETGKIWDCGHCAEAFKLESERELHEANAHSPQKSSIPLPYNCSRCPKKFRDYSEWQFHRALEHPDLAKLGCFYCDEIFKVELKEAVDVVDLAARTKHIKEHHGRNYYSREPYECRICGANFKSPTELKSHSQAEHGNNSDDLYWCTVCFQVWPSRVIEQRHIQNCHCQMPREKLICDICAYKTLVPSFLAEHRLFVHGLEPESGKSKIFRCTTEGCSFKCVLKRKFDAHLMKVHNAERRIKCKICGRGFLNTSQRNVHERTHGSAKPYQCEICGNSFAVQNYLYIHMRLSHQNRPFASTNRKRPPKSRRRGDQTAVENPTSHPPLNPSLPDCAGQQTDSSSQHSIQKSVSSSLHLLANYGNSEPVYNDEIG